MGFKILKIIFIVVIILNIIIAVPLIFIYINHQMKYIPYASEDIHINLYIDDIPTKEYAFKEINKIFNNPYYKYKEKNLTNQDGNCNIFWRKITINSNCNIRSYIFALTHELTHLTHFTSCERYCNFTAFKLLYQSDIIYFKYVALLYAKSDSQGLVPYTYSCWGQIADYLNI